MKHRSLLPLLSAPLVLLLAGCPTGGGGKNGAVSFSKSFGGRYGDEAVQAIPAAAGGFILAGARDVQVQGFRVGDEVESDAWVVRLDRLGNTQWQRSFGESLLVAHPGKDVYYDWLAAAPDGGTWLVGFESREDDDGVGAWEVVGSNLIVARLDASDQVLWRRAYDSGPFENQSYFFPGASTEELGRAISPTADGGALIASWLTAEVRSPLDPFDPKAPIRLQIANAVWILRIDADGNPLWDHQLGRNEAGEFPLGYFAEAYSGDPAMVVREAPGGGALVAASDRDLIQVHRVFPAGPDWVRTFPGAEIRDMQPLDEDGDGEQDDGLILVGRTLFKDSYVWKLTSQGAEAWRLAVDGFVHTVAHRVVVDALGADPYYAVGSSTEGGGKIQLLDSNGNPVGNADTEGGVRKLRWRASAGQYEAITVTYETLAGEIEAVGAFEEYDPDLVLRDRTALPLALPFQFEMTEEGGTVAFETERACEGCFENLLLTHQHPDGSFSVVDIDSGSERKNERAHAVVETADGDIVLLVSSRTLTTPEGGSPTLVVCLDAEGNTLWQQLLENVRLAHFAFGANPNPLVDVLVATADGGFALCAWADGFLRVIRLDATGNELWNSPPIAPLGTPIEDGLLCLIETRDGGFLAAGHDGNDAWLARLDDLGVTLWSELLTDQVERVHSLVEAEDGGLLVTAATESGAPILLELDASGLPLWSRAFPLEGFGFSEPLAGVCTPDGGFAFATTIWAEDSDAEGPGESGGDNALILKLDADGNPEWYRVYGALYRENLRSLRVLPDGGLLAAGLSESLGDNSEAWLLRLGFDGLITDGCNAYLGGGAWPTPPVDGVATATPYVPNVDPVEMVPAVLVISNVGIPGGNARSPVTARQCLGAPVAYEAPGEDPPPDGEPPPPGDVFTLAIESVGGGTGTVTSDPAGIDCGATCFYEFPAGTIVTLTPVADADNIFSHWEDCDTDLGPAGCTVEMSSDRVVLVHFESLMRVSGADAVGEKR